MVRTGKPARSIEIRAAALDLFTRVGYEATTMADIGAAIGIRGPSLYKYVSSKQDLLVNLMVETMDELISAHEVAVTGTKDPREQLRRATEAHVRYHARHRQEAFVGNRELRSLVEPHRAVVLARRSDYALRFRTLIENGLESGVFAVESPLLASYAILDLGMGVAVWFREDSGPTEDQVVWQYAQFALEIVGAHVRHDQNS